MKNNIAILNLKHDKYIRRSGNVASMDPCSVVKSGIRFIWVRVCLGKLKYQPKKQRSTNVNLYCNKAVVNLIYGCCRMPFKIQILQNYYFMYNLFLYEGETDKVKGNKSLCIV